MAYTVTVSILRMEFMNNHAQAMSMIFPAPVDLDWILGYATSVEVRQGS